MSDSEQVVLKSVEPQLVAASLGIIPNDREGAPSVIVPLFQKTSEYLINQGVTNLGNAICIYHDIEARNHQSIPIETIIPIFDNISATQEIWIYELPKVDQMASLVHRGSLDTLEEAYDQLSEWIKKNNYQIIGSVREVYVEYDDNRNPVATELQYPVKKIKNQTNIFSWFFSVLSNQD